MAICTVDGGLSSDDADVVAMADCERRAIVLARVAK